MTISFQDIQKLGLNQYESKLLYCLIQKDSLTATELWKITNIPRAKVYVAMEGLRKKHFCERVPGKEKLYRAIDPNNPILNKANEYKQKIDEMTKLGKLLSEEYKKNKNRVSEINYIEIVKDRNLIREKINQLENNTKNFFKCLVKAPYIVDVKRAVKGDYNKFNKKVKYCYIFDESAIYDELQFEFIKLCQENGVEIRICKKITVKAAIFDKKVLLLNMQDKVSTDITFTSIFVYHEDMIESYLDLFTYYYKQSSSLEEKIEELGIV